VSSASSGKAVGGTQTWGSQFACSSSLFAVCTPCVVLLSWVPHSEAGQSHILPVLLSCCPSGALLVNLGSLMTRWTNTLWASTLHRVTNPAPHKQHSSRRLSMAFFHKPAHDAVIEVLPTCYSSSSGDASSSSSSSSSRSGSSSRERVLPREPLYPPAVVGDLTRQGILHKLRHLPPEEASQAYHAILAGQRCADHGQETS
jgi:hypothetical protein